MSLTTQCRNAVNALLAPTNFQITTLTAERAESRRLKGLAEAGQFEKPVFPVLKSFVECNPSPILDEVARHEERFATFASAARGGQKFSFDNDYYSSPDAEVLYAMVRLYRPETIIEVGSGNSTLLFRQAISDAQLRTRLVSIDPWPRREIAQYSDEVLAQRVEDMRDLSRFEKLNANDVLFIDSSHELKPGNDVLFLLLHILPVLKPGVIIHIHDIFLPFEYPRSWVVDWKRGWTEQYLVQALLQDSTQYSVIWAGHYLQRTLPEFAKYFVHWKGNDAASLWLRKN